MEKPNKYPISSFTIIQLNVEDEALSSHVHRTFLITIDHICDPFLVFNTIKHINKESNEVQLLLERN